MPRELSFVEIQGDGLVLDAMKKGEWDDSLILRISNPTSKAIKGAGLLHTKISKVEVVNMMETEVEQELAVKDNSFVINIPSKKVVTLRVSV